MSVVVRPVDSEDIEAICDFLHVNFSSRISKGSWRNLLDYPWRPHDGPRGLVVLDAGRVAGVHGLICAERQIGGRSERFCNLSAWYLLPAYRGRGLGEALLREALGSTDVTYTNLTATAAAAQAFRKRGFEILDDERYLVRRRSRPATAATVLREVGPQHAAEGLRLGMGGQQIWRDHRGLNLRHVLFESDGAECYVVLSVKKKGADITYCEVLHASDLDVLGDQTQTFADHLLTSDEAVLAVDRRFLLKAPPTAEIEPIRLPRLYRSDRVARVQIDHLYSEIVLLDLKLP
jgi:GNAT superfamily N-acetyltransferase